MLLAVSPLTVLLFFLVASLYSMMGFGGGSSYLAVLILMGYSYLDIPPIALICNLMVSGTAFWQFAKAGHFDFKKILPFVIFSIPMAYWGGRMPISKQLFSILLGLALMAVAIRMMISGKSEAKMQAASKSWIVGLPLGGVIGFFSGMLGIGGGIFLSPLLLLIRWADAKQAAASASFFIFVNSLAALAGHLQKAPLHFEGILPLIAAVLLGGQIGSRFGAHYLPEKNLRQMLGAFIMYASMRLLWSAL